MAIELKEYVGYEVELQEGLSEEELLALKEQAETDKEEQ